MRPASIPQSRPSSPRWPSTGTSAAKWTRPSSDFTHREKPNMPIICNKDACDLLDADHIAVKHLLVEYARLAMAAARDSTAQRTELAAKICEELTVHAQIEEELFYPALREAAPDAGAPLDEARAEHQEAKELIAQIQSL